VELNLGDIVKLSDGRIFNFYCEVKYLEDEKVITPFHTFSFHSVEKVDQVPANAKLSTEERYKIWYVYSDEAELDENPEHGERYLMDWRQCEYLLEERMFQIHKIEP